MSPSSVPRGDAVLATASHPVAGTALVVVPVLAALACLAVAAPWDRPAAALLAYLAMGTIAGFSVSGST